MRNSTAYFAGVATVFSATALGFAGAMMLSTATTPRSPAEHTKLERSDASSGQASSPDKAEPAVRAYSSETTQDSNQSLPPPADSSVAPQSSAKRTPTASPPAQTSNPGRLQPETSVQPTTAGAAQPATSSQAGSAANAYGRSSDEDVTKYIRKRQRQWAHRHYRNEGTTTAVQDAKSPDQSDQSQRSVSENKPTTPAETQPGQTKTAEQTATKANDADTSKAKRKHDRHWARGYQRNDDRGHDEDRARSLEVREMPGEDAPQTFFEVPRWRPFFSDSDDD